MPKDNLGATSVVQAALPQRATDRLKRAHEIAYFVDLALKSGEAPSMVGPETGPLVATVRRVCRHPVGTEGPLRQQATVAGS